MWQKEEDENVLDGNTNEVSASHENEDRNALHLEKLTDLDLARLPRVWIVLEMRVRVREVAGSYADKKTGNPILKSYFTWAHHGHSGPERQSNYSVFELKSFRWQQETIREEKKIKRCFQKFNLKHLKQHIFSSSYFQRYMCICLSIGCIYVLQIRLTGWCGRRWNKLGERMAGAKKRRKIKLLTAVYRTSWSTREKEGKQLWLWVFIPL